MPTTSASSSSGANPPPISAADRAYIDHVVAQTQSQIPDMPYNPFVERYVRCIRGDKFEGGEGEGSGGSGAAAGGMGVGGWGGGAGQLSSASESTSNKNNEDKAEDDNDDVDVGGARTALQQMILELEGRICAAFGQSKEELRASIQQSKKGGSS